MAASAGVKVTAWSAVPASGTVAGAVNAKLPVTNASPPLNAESASVWPYSIAAAVGQVDTAGSAFATVELGGTLLWRGAVARFD